MADYTQDERIISIDTPLGADELLLRSFSGQEEISRLFSYQLDLLSERHDIAPNELVGKRVNFTIEGAAGETRYFNGFVSRLSAGGADTRGFRQYQAEVVPWLWFLSRTADCRIFQTKTVPQIIEQIFTELGFTDFETANLTGQYRVWNYCVQYRETDFNFISRLMEQEGIFYWFTHEQNKHKLILADSNSSHEFLAEREVKVNHGSIEDAHINYWEHQYEFVSGKWTQTDYNFETPSANMQSSSPTVVDLPGVPESTQHKDNYEIFDYPGEYKDRDEGDPLTRIRMEQDEVGFHIISAASDCRTFYPGGKFSITEHPNTDEEGKTYIITSISHNASNDSYVGGGASNSEEYGNSFTCIPDSVAFRPKRITTKPIVQGPQTAVVVGPAREEIYTDDHGRVKVQFHWDREGEMDEYSSCWIRVSQIHAGKGFGAIDVPRIGEEVIVQFLEGDPDRPIVIGRVYNGENTPPNGLPGKKMVSGIKSNSTPGGGGDNAIMLDDTKKNEKITIHAQYDMNTTVDHDQTNTVKNDFTETITNNAKITINEGTYNHDVKDNTATFHVMKKVTEKYDDEQETTVKKNVTIKSAEAEIHLEAAEIIKLHTGESTIEMNKNGEIKITGVNVTVKGSSSVTINGGMVTSKADSQHETKGAVVISEGSATNSVKGGTVLLNP